jgi:hypothetical protein
MRVRAPGAAQPPAVASDGEGVVPPPRAAGADTIREGHFVVLAQQSDKSSLVPVKANGCAQPPQPVAAPAACIAPR